MVKPALHKKSGQKSDSAVNKDFLVSFWRFFEIKKTHFGRKKHRQGTLFVQSHSMPKLLVKVCGDRAGSGVPGCVATGDGSGADGLIGLFGGFRRIKYSIAISTQTTIPPIHTTRRLAGGGCFVGGCWDLCPGASI